MKIFILLSYFFVPLSHSQTSGDIEKGRKIAQAVCVACHGPKGISNNDLWPNLAGQKREYMIKQLQDFKAQRRYDPLMSPQAATLSEKDMLDISSYFTQLKNE